MVLPHSETSKRPLYLEQEVQVKPYDGHHNAAELHRIQRPMEGVGRSISAVGRVLPMKIELISNCKTVLGESPLWDIREQRLYWVDCLGGNIYRASEDGNELQAWSVGSTIGSLALREKGGAVLALESGIHLFDFVTGQTELVCDLGFKGTSIRLNDGKVDRQGRVLTVSMDTQHQKPEGILYTVDADLLVRELDSGLIVGNGPCWSVDGRTLFISDSMRRTIWAYDYDGASGDISRKRIFANASEGDGLPDGATVDAEDHVWSASWCGGHVLRYAPDGTIERSIELPVRGITSVMFGGLELNSLYVTSIMNPPGTAARSHDGRLFKISGLNIRGVAERRFVG